jgi:hypothetical protein
MRKNAAIKTTGTYGLNSFRRVRKIAKRDHYYLRRVCLSVRLSVLPHGTIRLQLDGFSWNFDVWVFFENLSRKFKFSQNLTRLSTLRDDQYTFLITCRSRTASYKTVEKIKTHILRTIIFSSRKSCLLWGNVEKYFRCRTGHRWHCMRACYIPEATKTHSEHVMIIIWDCNNSCKNAPHCYAICTFSVLFVV